VETETPGTEPAQPDEGNGGDGGEESGGEGGGEEGGQEE
jgi:hypothetical protein